VWQSSACTARLLWAFEKVPRAGKMQTRKNMLFIFTSAVATFSKPHIEIYGFRI
jgi:hypothetical protein